MFYRFATSNVNNPEVTDKRPGVAIFGQRDHAGLGDAHAKNDPSSHPALQLAISSNSVV